MKSWAVVGSAVVVGVGAWYLLNRNNASKTIQDMIDAGKIPADFTATEAQLNTLIAEGYAPESNVYQTFLDMAYFRIESQAMGQYVLWEPDKGYYVLEVV